MRRTVRVGTVTGQFRVGSPAEEWWFEDSTLAGERSVVEDVVERLRPDDVFFDVGANVGLYACLAGQVPTDGSVVAFEPHSTTVDRLRENLDENAVDATVVGKALGASADRRSLRTPPDNPSNGRHTHVAAGSPERSHTGDSEGTDDRLAGGSGDADPPPTVGETREVPIERGDALVASGEIPPPTVLKVDVEGAEHDVLTGLDASLRSQRCRLVYCELHPDRLRERGSSRARVRTLLRSHGFTVETVQELPDGRSIVRARREPDDTTP